jgi:hypothetical protein
MRVQVSDAHHESDDDAHRQRGRIASRRVVRILRAATSAFDLSARHH